MYYKSTRDSSLRIDSAVAISKGISEEGGLFVPESIPQITIDELKSLADMNYAQRAAAVFAKYLTDFTEAELVYCLSCGTALHAHSRIWLSRSCLIS